MKLTARQQVRAVVASAKRAFSSDGCTSVPDFNFGKDCCAQHDRDYFDCEITRAEADRRMRECISRKGYLVLPWVYWIGVRIFGRGFWYGRKR